MTMSPISRRIFCACLALAALGGPAQAAGSGEEDGSPPASLRVALHGYDPVAYFTDGAPKQGSPQFWSVFDDTVYYFESATHRALFVNEPDRYAPQYAGFCTGGVAMGMARVEADPHAWVITRGRLFVFFAKSDVDDFQKNPEETVSKADANWRQMQAER
jgi:YHS domain-containing protein